MTPVQSRDTPQEQGATEMSQETFALANLGSNVKLVLKRKWRDGSMYYIATLSPYEDKVKEARESTLWSSAAINLDLEDQDGFAIHTLSLKVDEMRRIVDAQGTPTALTTKGNVALSASTYRSIKMASVGWSGFSR
jgi:hypothetical protein